MNFSGTYRTILMPVGIVGSDDRVISDCANFVISQHPPRQSRQKTSRYEESIGLGLVS